MKTLICVLLVFLFSVSLYAYDEVYLKSVVDEIRGHWNPDIDKKGLDAIVAIKILRDGTVIVQKIEKSSGNVAFDKECMRALAKSSPLKPPPDGIEVEVSVRFFP